MESYSPKRGEAMNSRSLALVSSVLVFAGCGSAPIALKTYDNKVLKYPDDFPNDQPIILAFLNVDDRTCDQAIRPLRAFSARDEVYLVGVMTYSDNAFLNNISTAPEIVFPVMLDPSKAMFDHFGVSPARCPTYIYLSPNGKVIDRQRDIKKIKDWYKSVWIDKALGRRHKVTPDEEVEKTGT